MNPQPSIPAKPRMYDPVWIASSGATLIEDKYTCFTISPSSVGTDIVWVQSKPILTSEEDSYHDLGVLTSPDPKIGACLLNPRSGVYIFLECKFHEYTFAPFDYRGTRLFRSTSSSAPDAADPALGPVGPAEVSLKYGNTLYSMDRITSEETTVEEAMSIVADAFAQFSEVRGIYMQRWRSELQFVVMLNIEKYDSDLIDRLLDVECDLLQYESGGLLWDFAYLPCKGRDSTEVVSPSATVVFSR